MDTVDTRVSQAEREAMEAMEAGVFRGLAAEITPMDIRRLTESHLIAL